jgi:hypothetical protein
MSRAFLVHYKMADPKGFWDDLKTSISSLPKPLQMLFSTPNLTGTEVFTMWSESEDGALAGYLKQHPGSLASYNVTEVDLKRTRGLVI